MFNMLAGVRGTMGGILARGRRIPRRSTAYFKHVFMSGALIGAHVHGNFMIKNVFGS